MRYAMLLPALALLALSACQPSETSLSRAPSASSVSARQPTYRVYSHTPPGIFKFGQRETYKDMDTELAKVVALYPVKLEDGSPGQLIVLSVERYRGRKNLYGVVQPDVAEFTFHRGEQVISVRSAGYYRILPFKAPPPTTTD